jgi:hypothetical protein
VQIWVLLGRKMDQLFGAAADFLATAWLRFVTVRRLKPAPPKTKRQLNAGGRRLKTPYYTKPTIRLALPVCQEKNEELSNLF